MLEHASLHGLCHFISFKQERGLGFELGQSLDIDFKLPSVSVASRRGHFSGRNGGVDATQDDKVRGPEPEGLAEALPYSGAHSRRGNTSLTSVGPCCLLVPINPSGPS